MPALGDLARAFWCGRAGQFLALAAALAAAALAAILLRAPFPAVFAIFAVNFLCFAAALIHLPTGLSLWAFWAPLLTINLNLWPGLPTLSFDKALVAMLLLAWAARGGLNRPRDSLHGWPARLWLVLLGAAALTLVATGENVLRQVWHWGEIASYFLIFWLARETLTREEDRRRVLLGLLAGCALATAAVCAQYLFYRLSDGAIFPSLHFEWNLPARRLQFGGTFGHQNFYAAYQLLMIPLALAVLRDNGRRWPGLAALLAAQLLSLGAGQSLGGFIGLTAGLAVLAAYWAPVSRRTAAVAAVILAMAGLMAVVFWQVNPRVPKRKWDASVLTRLYFHRIAFAAWRERPVLGHGLGRFPGVFAGHAARAGLQEASESGLTPGRARALAEGVEVSAHSIYLKALVENGALGAALLVLLGAAVARALARRRRLSRPPSSAGGLALAALSALAGVAAQGATEELLSHSKLSFLFWTLMGMALFREASSPAGPGSGGETAP